MDLDLKTVLNKRLEELGMTQYELAIAYGRKQNPDSEKSDRDIGNQYLSTVRKVLTSPETCKPATLRGVVEAMSGRLVMQIEFFDTKTYRLSA